VSPPRVGHRLLRIRDQDGSTQQRALRWDEIRTTVPVGSGRVMARERMVTTAASNHLSFLYLPIRTMVRIVTSQACGFQDVARAAAASASPHACLNHLPETRRNNWS
jgi:hypothetical protein